MLATSCRTELDQRWRGRVILEGARAVRWGNMVIAVSIASPIMDWRWLARSRMWAVVVCDTSLCPCEEIYSREGSRESRSERAMAFAIVVAKCESTATWAFHSSRV